MAVPLGFVISVTRKNRKMSIKVAQKWFHQKNWWLWHLCKNCLRIREIFAEGFKKLPQSPINRPIWSHCLWSSFHVLNKNLPSQNCMRESKWKSFFQIFTGKWKWKNKIVTTHKLIFPTTKMRRFCIRLGHLSQKNFILYLQLASLLWKRYIFIVV